MNLIKQTKQYIAAQVNWFYAKAIEAGAKVSDITHIGANMYRFTIGKMELTYLGTPDGKAKPIACSGEIF